MIEDLSTKWIFKILIPSLYSLNILSGSIKCVKNYLYFQHANHLMNVAHALRLASAMLWRITLSGRLETTGPSVAWRRWKLRFMLRGQSGTWNEIWLESFILCFVLMYVMHFCIWVDACFVCTIKLIWTIIKILNMGLSL